VSDRSRKGKSRPQAKQPADDAKGKPRKWLSIGIGTVAVLVAAFLLHRTLSKYSLDEIVASVAAIPMPRIAAAAGFAAASYLCLTGFDWLALRYVGHPLRYRYVALTSFVSLSLGHNIGLAALSSGAIRYRFYSRRGLGIDEIAKVILFCGLTVGLGLLMLGGGALLLRSGLAAEMTGLGQGVILAIGISCFAAGIGYLALSFFVKKPLRWRKWSLEMPSPRLAVAQLALGPLNFMCVAACLHQTLLAVADLPYLAVVAAYVVAGVAALISHVPGGLGVIETVLQILLPGGQIIGALVMFRVIYFLVPLCLGSVAFASAELVLAGQHVRKRKRS
jgi:uncharacterized membrane protein YbhN (UPF0104 family)